MVYGGQVAEIINAALRDSTYKPAIVMDLAIVHRRKPRSVDELGDDERIQLTAMWRLELAAALESPEQDIEAAEVVDGDGAVRYRLYGWNYGVGYLMNPQGLDIVAFGSQHDVEHWNLAQRDVFVAMDRALLKQDHGFQQPLEFCWWREECWSAIAGKPLGTVGSEPALRKYFGVK